MRAALGRSCAPAVVAAAGAVAAGRSAVRAPRASAAAAAAAASAVATTACARVSAASAASVAAAVAASRAASYSSVVVPAPAATASTGAAAASAEGGVEEDGAFRRLASPPAGVVHFQPDHSHLRVPVLRWTAREGVAAFTPKANRQVVTSEDFVELNPAVFGEAVRPDLLQRVVEWQRAGWRAGHKQGKTRAEVRHSTRKLRPQKGQGKARIGSRGSPHHRGGGVAFPAQARDFSFPLPRAVRRRAVRVALSAKAAQGKLHVIDSLSMPGPKTNAVRHLMQANDWHLGAGVLFVAGGFDVDEAFRLSQHNLYNTLALPARGVHVYGILRHDHVVVELDALPVLEDRLLFARAVGGGPRAYPGDDLGTHEVDEDEL